MNKTYVISMKINIFYYDKKELSSLKLNEKEEFAIHIKQKKFQFWKI